MRAWLQHHRFLLVFALLASPWFLLGCVIAISFFMPLRFVSLWGRARCRARTR